MSQQNNQRRIVVTGMGIVSPVGSTLDTAWGNLLAGHSGITPITLFDASQFNSRISGVVQGFDVEQYLNKKEMRKMDEFIHYAIAASDDALKDAGLEITEANAERIGACIGSGIGGLPGISKNYQSYIDGGARKISPFFVPGSIVNMAAGQVSIRHGLKGPNYSIVTACTSGTHSIADAARMIVYGDADVMIAGGAEMATCPLGIGGFSAARALSKNNDNPAAASRPWDTERDGFVLADGAGVLVLESLEHATQRGAQIYAELVGSGMSSDAYHMTAPPADGSGAALCMRNALRNAGINAESIDYINAHGTSTLVGDKAETAAIKLVFGERAYQIAVSSSKSMTGHLLGAAGGIEAIFSILALRDQVAPPTINLDNPDPACDLDYVPHTAREMKLDVVMSNSFGFGGTNGTLIFKKFSD
ncbi:beta-ketoacyl-ACP synthase II [Candidatus Venteria ishoeyi]|uniref:3-oxoacyl-[acyl-carrier-protein] synthase 2 n=1 Tax=Candidatus Venteria ishoeyi TaxID=1899563 RepID=A0A1H6F680_9GAMM|nr:beta-ketoacyl-ACP synthase II [Candidatus Venteria ishoeyi]MDM8547510.1 beta-ketoacyl-ACP synthase II [Candidatus Venteria ishoeyi]SEH05660.1 3-oxoacyl-[acyl-carrier-protein] synthase 2 [Candidatus Venteria ishoeyi]